MSLKLDLERITQDLVQNNTPIIEGYSFAPLVQLAQAHGLHSHDIFIDVSSIPEVHSDVALIVTYADEGVNNGVYAYCAQPDGSTAMMVIQPSTISKGPMISRVTGDVVDAITGIENMPILTTFDKVEVIGGVIGRTVLEPLMDTLGIPEAGRELFEKLYLPRLMANIAFQYLGSDQLKEEMVEMEPYTVKQMVLQSLRPQEDDTDVSQDA